MMGRSPVFLPVDRRYARNHMWAEPVDGGFRLGLTGFAVKLLGDIRHLTWSVEPGAEVESGQQIAFVEASKATSDLYAPLGGRIARLNPDVPANPTLLNSNLYDTGWLLEVAGDAAGQLLSVEDYQKHLEAAWPLTQRLLKGQVGNRAPLEEEHHG
jgi:glycine cleavage system H protein